MSRIGKLPIKIQNGVTVNKNEKNLSIKGPKGELKIELHPFIDLEIDEKEIRVKNLNELEGKAIHGLYRALINNMMVGVTNGFEKKLEIIGVGFKAQVQGKKLILNLGFSHPVEYQIPTGIEIKQDPEKKNILYISGIDKELVGSSAAKIRGFKKPEPYKGKGIKYSDEVIVRKAGKTAASGKDK